MRRRDFIKTLGVAGVASTFAVGAGSLTNASLEGNARTVIDAHGLNSPFDLTFDPSGNLFVSDPPSYQIKRLNSELVPVGFFGKPGSQIGRLNYPKGLACDADGLIYVVDSNNCRIQIFDIEGQVKRSVGSIGSIGGSFSTPQGVFVDDQRRMLVADTRNHRVQVFKDFELISVLGELGDARDQFRLPTSCAYTPDNDIIVLDSKHGMIKIFAADFAFKKSFGAEGSSPGQFNLPQGMSLSREGTIWIADTGNQIGRASCRERV